jgi:aspartyl protease family protein
VNIRSKNSILILIIVIILSCFLGLITWLYPGAVNDRNSQIQLIYGTVLLSLFLIPSLFYSKIKPIQAIKYAVIWINLGGLVFIGYAFRDEGSVVFKRLLGELMPSLAQSSGQTEILRMGKDGHFNVDALVDGKRIQFLIDTGASDIVLSPFDAKRLGFNLTKLKYSKSYSTANGIVSGAPIILSKISIGKINVNNISATVNGVNMKRSLLGMHFLGQLSRFEIVGNNLILSP